MLYKIGPINIYKTKTTTSVVLKHKINMLFFLKYKRFHFFKSILI